MIAENTRFAVDLANEPQFQLGALEVRPATREVVSGVRRQVVEPRIMQVLVALARRRGEVVSREELFSVCWAGRTVGEDAINRCIAAVRRIAGAYGGFTIDTVARVGYRLDEAPAPADTTPAAATRHPAKRPALVGRAGELGLLRSALDEALAGRGGLVLLSGEAGVGKTRLTREIGAEAGRRGALVLMGHCHEAAGAAPYTPFVELLEETARKLSPERFREALGEVAPQVAMIFPELRRRFSDIPPPIELSARLERRYLFNSLREFLERVARAQTLVLVLEDLHWADDATLSLLSHVAERVGEMPLLVACTYRDAGRDAGGPLFDWQQEIVRRRLGERIRLTGLAEAETGALICELVGQDFPRARLVGPDVIPAWVSQVHTTTQGNPLFVEELIKHLSEDGRLFDGEGHLRANVVFGDLDVPEGVRLVIDRRLTRLSHNAGQVLAAAALIGSRFRVELLLALDLGEAEAVLDALDEGETAGLVAPENGGYRFAHDVIRQTIIASLPLQRRRRLHLRIANAMEHLYGRQIETHATELGHHLSEAGPLADPAKAIHHLLLAGNQALKAAAFDEALNRFEAGLAAASAEPSRERALLLYGRAQCRSPDRWDDAMDDCRQALAIHEQLADSGAVANVCIELALQFARVMRGAEATDICRRGLVALGERRCADRARLLGVLSYALCIDGQYDEGEWTLREAEELVIEIGDPTATAYQRAMSTLVCNSAGERRRAAEEGRQAAQLLLETGDSWWAATVLDIAAGALFALARWDEAALLLDAAEPLAERVGNWRASIGCQLTRSYIAGFGNGVFFDQRDHSYLWKLTKAPSQWNVAIMQIGLAAYRHGRWEEAVSHFEEGMGEGRFDPYFPARWSALVVTRARMGDRVGAEKMLADWPSNQKPGTEASPRFPVGWDRRYCIAEALVVLGRLDEAAGLYSPLLSHLQHRAIRGVDFRLLQPIVAMTAAAAGKWDEAEHHFRSALDLAEALPHRIEQAYTRQDWAEALLRRGGGDDRERARQLLSEAAERYEGMGMVRHLDVARTMIGVA